ncbi:MAG: glycoside hydrolase family 38 C-terminal domain-containing protein, partial [Thermoanaerobaculia bacterium]
PVVLFNPLGWPRREVVEVVLPAAAGTPLVAIGPEGAEASVQLLDRDGEQVRALFAAELPAHGFAVYRLAAGDAALLAGAVAAGPDWIENDRYRAELDAAGRLVRLHDRGLDRDLLAAPVDLQLLPDRSSRWPAWEIRAEDLAPGEERALDGPAEVHLVEAGPLRATLETRRTVGESSFAQRFTLTAGGEWLEIETRVDWRARDRLLKLAFPLAASPENATYDLACGAIERGVNSRELYEVPAQQWADLSTAEFGVSVLSPSTRGWDRPAAHLLRSSLVRSPAAGRKFRHQADQDHGEHRFRHGLYGHPGDWRDGGTVAAAARLEEPVLAFVATPHPGPLGRRFALVGVSGEVAVRALKKAEDDEALIVRLQETRGRTTRGVRLALPTALRSARATDGRERPHLEVPPRDGDLELDFLPFELRTLALAPEPTRHPLAPPSGRPQALPYDHPAVSFHGDRPIDFDGRGRSFPGELWPEAVVVGGVRVPLGPAAPGLANALACAGQELAWEEPAERLLLLLASAGGTRVADLAVGGRRERARVPCWTGPIGCYKGWEEGLTGQRWAPPETGFVERVPVAWTAGHRHDGRLRDEPYEQAYLFRLELDLEAGDWSLRLPNDPAIRLFAALLLTESHPRLVPSNLLY